MLINNDNVTLAYNVSRLCAGGASRLKSFNPPLMFNRITNDE